MSLPACEQRELDEIATQLRTGAPHLASMFAIFTRLENGEGAPLAERLLMRPRRCWRPRRWRSRWSTRGGGRRHRTSARRGPAGRPARRSTARRWFTPASKMAALVPLLLVVAISAVLFGLGRPAAAHGCASVQAVSAWRSDTTGRAAACRSQRRPGAVRVGPVGGQTAKSRGHPGRPGGHATKSGGYQP
jgi:hypothetical protein